MNGRNPRPPPVVMHVLRVNVTQVLNIDHVSQKFGAALFLHLRIMNGTEDADLVRDIDEEKATFPKDTLRPSARWFLQQFDFPTAQEFHIIESKCVIMGPHVDLVLKVRGTFFEVMELSVRAKASLDPPGFESHRVSPAALPSTCPTAHVLPQDFPVDTQELSIVVSVSVANEGICGIKFSNLLDEGGDVVATVNKLTFSMSNMCDASCSHSAPHQLVH